MFILITFIEFYCLSYEVAPGSEITHAIKIFGKRYDVHNNVAYITCNDKIITFYGKKLDSKVTLMSFDK